MFKLYRFLFQAIVILLLTLQLSAVASAQGDLGMLRRRARGGALPQSGAAGNVSPGAWSELGQLVPATLAGRYGIGLSVAIDGDTTVLATIPDFTVNNAGGYVFTKPAKGWSNLRSTAALIVPASVGASNCSVAMQGDVIVIGADDSTYGPGAAYVFVKPAGGWTDMLPTATLLPSDGVANDDFGRSVAINGNAIVVGADDTDSYAGAAYVYVKPAGGWTDMRETAKLTASDGQPYDFMGQAVAISGNTVVTGAPQKLLSGKAYVFVEPAGGWGNMTQTAELTAANGQTNGNLGGSVSISESTILVGAVDIATASGAAYVYVKPTGGWKDSTQTATLTASQGKDYFGNPVVISGKSAIVGAPLRSPAPNFEEGGAFVFSEPQGGWQNMVSNIVLTGSDARRLSWFGDALAVSGKTLVVGAPALNFSGAAYVFGLP